MNSNSNDNNYMGFADILAGKDPEQYEKEKLEQLSKEQQLIQYNLNINSIQDYKEDLSRKKEKLKITFDAAHYVTARAILLMTRGLSTLPQMVMSELFKYAVDVSHGKSLKQSVTQDTKEKSRLKEFTIDTIIKKSGDLYIPYLIDSKIFGITQLKEDIQRHRKQNKILKEMIEADGYKMKFKKNLRIPRKNQFI